jgi:hypothetical protein
VGSWSDREGLFPQVVGAQTTSDLPPNRPIRDSTDAFRAIRRAYHKGGRMTDGMKFVNAVAESS